MALQRRLRNWIPKFEIKMCIIAIVFKLYKNIYDIHLSRVRLTLQTRRSYICSTPELSESNFCDDPKTKLTSPLDGIQQADAPDTVAKIVIPFFYLGLVIASG